MSDEPLVVVDDGLYTPGIGEHSLKKIHVHNRYCRMFTTAMRDKWQMAYVGLYSGAGRARVKTTGAIVETSALGAMRQPHLPEDCGCRGGIGRCGPAVGASVRMRSGCVNSSSTRASRRWSPAKWLMSSRAK